MVMRPRSEMWQCDGESKGDEGATKELFNGPFFSFDTRVELCPLRIENKSLIVPPPFLPHNLQPCSCNIIITPPSTWHTVWPSHLQHLQLLRFNFGLFLFLKAHFWLSQLQARLEQMRNGCWSESRVKCVKCMCVCVWCAIVYLSLLSFHPTLSLCASP